MVFVNIPYVLHNSLQAPGVQFGCFIHTKELLRRIDYIPAIYRKGRRNGKLTRIGAPDCEIRFFLLRHGAREIRAVPPAFKITTRHYSNDGTYGLFRAGRMSHHAQAEQLLGFDPVAHGMAMELESCLALSAFCHQVGIRTAVNLGTGAGNSLRSMLAAGVSDIISVDEDPLWTLHASKSFDQTSAAISFLTCPLLRTAKTTSYDLSEFRQRHFDLVVIDGPAGGSGRLAAARQVHANHYAFHDSLRDAQTIERFVATIRDSGQPCSITRMNSGRGLTFVSLTGITPQRLEADVKPADAAVTCA